MLIRQINTNAGIVAAASGVGLLFVILALLATGNLNFPSSKGAPRAASASQSAAPSGLGSPGLSPFPSGSQPLS